MILMACACFPPEPVVAATLTHDLATRLSAGHKVRVLTPRPTRPFGFTFGGHPAGAKDFEHIILPSYTCSRMNVWGRVRESYSYGKHVSEYIRKNHTCIRFVYVCTWPLLAPCMILRTSRKYSIPSVVHVEDIYPESFASKFPVLGWLIKRILLPVDAYNLKKASKIIAVSENMRNYLIQTRNIPPAKIELIHNWQDESEFIRFHEKNPDKPADHEITKPFTFMYLGNIGPVSGIDYVIRCFNDAGIPNTQLVIAGSGSMKKVCEEIARKLNNPGIRFLDVPHGKVPEVQGQADVMLLHVRRGSAMSSVPSKLPAYMFSRKPVIASVDDASDTARTVRAARCGWVVPPEAPARFVQVLQDAAGCSHDALKDMGMSGFQYAMEHFSKRKNLHQIAQLISESVRTGRSSHGNSPSVMTPSPVS